MGTPQASQTVPLLDTPTSHLRNALAILELLELDNGTTIGRATLDVAARITAAIELLATRQPAFTLEPAVRARLEQQRLELEADAEALGEQLAQARRDRARRPVDPPHLELSSSEPRTLESDLREDR